MCINVPSVSDTASKRQSGSKYYKSGRATVIKLVLYGSIDLSVSLRSKSSSRMRLFHTVSFCPVHQPLFSASSRSAVCIMHVWHPFVNLERKFRHIRCWRKVERGRGLAIWGKSPSPGGSCLDHVCAATNFIYQRSAQRCQKLLRRRVWNWLKFYYQRSQWGRSAPRAHERLADQVCLPTNHSFNPKIYLKRKGKACVISM